MRQMEDLKVKINACKRSLLTWSTKEFKNNIIEINKVKARLMNLGNTHGGQVEHEEEHALKSRLHALWKREEIFLGQRSRVKWLVHRYKNSKFFHQTTLARRRRNKILPLRGLNGTWMEGEIDKREEIHIVYSVLFEKDRTHILDEDNYEIWNSKPKGIADEVNIELTKLASPEEIRKAVFQMGGGGV